jgi:hypothetical protein
MSVEEFLKRETIIEDNQLGLLSDNEADFQDKIRKRIKEEEYVIGQQ